MVVRTVAPSQLPALLAQALREAFGPVIHRLANNNIDLTKMPSKLVPIAHHHMGGAIADERMKTLVPGLLVRR